MGLRKTLSMMALMLLPALLAQVAPQEPQELIQNGLFNDKSGAGTFWTLTDGGLGTMEIVPSKEQNASGTMTIKVNDISTQPWTMQLMQQVASGVPKGTVVYISFDYRISPGYSFNFYWQEERPPWPKLLSLHIDSPTETWQRVQMAVPIHEELKPDGTSFSFHLAEQVGICELRNISAKVLPEGTNPYKLNTNVNPVLGGDFYDKDWRDAATARLEKLRKVNVKARIIRNNIPSTKGEVKFRQIDRPFKFGAETSLAIINTKALEAKDNKLLRKNLSKDIQSIPEYRKILLDKDVFDFITLNDGLTWRDYDSWGSKYAKEAVDIAITEMGIYLRGHALYIPAFMFAPVRCRKMNKEALANALLKHVGEITEAFKGRITEWEVLHGGVEYTEIYNMIGAESMLQVFKTVAEKDPDAKLLVSDPTCLSDLSDDTMENSVKLLKWLIESGVKLDGVVLHANMKRLDVAPQSMEKRLDYIYNELKLPLHIANFTVNNESDEFQSAAISDYMLLFFSHKAVHSVSFAEGWAPMLLNPKTAYYNENLEPRQSMRTIRTLITEKWVSNATLEIDEAGISESESLFKGTYEVVASSGGNSRTYAVNIDSLANAGKEVTFDGGQAKIEEGELVISFVFD
ncbi:MAG: endo-1,4-beta-xylanase [Victivallales bacterium]|nr:endo-1,4-beta-xylanase [Victivallales bacterium]